MTSPYRMILRCRWPAILMAACLPVMALAVVAQAYQFVGTAPAGALVAADPSHSGSVVLATTQNLSDLSGVIVPATSSGLTLGKGQVLVSSSGAAEVLVSDGNGQITKGDYVTVSQVAGVGAKAKTSETMLGVAQSNFTGHESGDVQHTIGSGQNAKTIRIGQIPVQLGIGVYTPNSSGPSSYIPASVQRLANALAGRTVSPTRILLAAIILILGLIGSIVIVYASIKSSLLSIGRNPLSSSSVYRSLAQVGLIIVILLGVCLGAVYAVIRL